jgi:PAS domain S-box-containing protein
MRQCRALEAEIRIREETGEMLLRALDGEPPAKREKVNLNAELRDFIENAVQCLHWVGPDGRILWANQAELDLLGYSRDEYFGHHISEFHVDAETIQNVLNRLANGETLRNYDARLRCKDGSIRYVAIDSNVLREDGKFVHTQCFTRDLSELKTAERAQSFLGSIVESADDAIISKTLDGIVTSWNPGAERLFGYSADEMVGKPISILIPRYQPNEEPWILERLRCGDRIDHYETQRIRKDGQIIDISITVSPVKDRAGRIIGASKIARDITERKRLEAEYRELLAREQKARLQAESASRMKDEFLAVLSHELRTPLNAILGWTSILGSRPDPDLMSRAVEIIQRNAAAQKRLIEDLLDMGRIVSGKMVIKSEIVDLIAVINAALDSVRPAALTSRCGGPRTDPAVIPEAMRTGFQVVGRSQFHQIHAAQGLG